ncbi:hypothetical protein [Peterkaempfera griseoplana]|uniref:hypothetical protein n=1 Tax=Peterkaempfera griseoplana TaxID=66896 RepID=UPI0006E1BBF6|nr:hypothetical protein [Peterkaempfera griseoplana]
MAVTQQLARVSAEYLAACRQSADESSEGDPHWEPPSVDWLDLDWAPAMLERVCALARLDAVRLQALRRATEGDTEIDLSFLNKHPHAIGPLGPSPTALSAPEVARVSTLLGGIDMQAILSVLPADDNDAGAVIGYGAEGIIGGPIRARNSTHCRAWTAIEGGCSPASSPGPRIPARLPASGGSMPTA